MKKIYAKVRRKFLLGVFKLRRIINLLLRARRLDYSPRNIYVLTDTIREYETRARSVRKEPKTVSWIEQHTHTDGVLYDIGANVGAYSLIAAVRGMRVVAFEPAHQNIYRLHENAILNKLTDKIIVVPLMLEAHSGVATSFINNMSFGTTHSFSFGEQPTGTEVGRSFLGITLDRCVEIFSLPLPTMIKIDVDGAEVDVLSGAMKLLTNPTLVTMLIETDDTHRDMIKRLCANLRFVITDEERAGDIATNFIFERR